MIRCRIHRTPLSSVNKVACPAPCCRPFYQQPVRHSLANPAPSRSLRSWPSGCTHFAQLSVAAIVCLPSHLRLPGPLALQMQDLYLCLLAYTVFLSQVKLVLAGGASVKEAPKSALCQLPGREAWTSKMRIFPDQKGTAVQKFWEGPEQRCRTSTACTYPRHRVDVCLLAVTLWQSLCSATQIQPCPVRVALVPASSGGRRGCLHFFPCTKRAARVPGHCLESQSLVQAPASRHVCPGACFAEIVFAAANPESIRLRGGLKTLHFV